MNRVTSVITGAAVAAVSGAAIAAAAVGQGVFSGSPTKSTAQDTVQVASIATETTETTDATAEAATPQIVYVDKDPIYISRTVVQPVADSPAPPIQPTATPPPKPTTLISTSEQPRPTATQPPAPTPITAVNRTGGDDHEGSHSGTPTTGTTGRTSGHDD
jgi:hypothetical protein